MSIALERLSAADRRAIAESLLVDPRDHQGDEITAHCPFHSEKSPGGAFFYNYDKDLAHCMSCGQSDDLVGIYNAVSGRAVADAEGCREFIREYCPENGARVIPQRRQREQQPRRWEPGRADLPPGLWMERAAVFVEHSVERLQDNPEQLAELAAYGITAETAQACKFGWNNQDKWVPNPSWGLPEATNSMGKPKKIWLPMGLVMPAIRDGHVYKLKIRRPNPRTPWGDDRKYWEVAGGANRLYHVYGRATCWVWVLVETERDAALIWQQCRMDGVGAIGIGGASKRPCDHVAGLLRRARVVLNALDYDTAGASNTWNFWVREFPNSIRYPAPPSLGKDVGDAARAGLNVRQWVRDGLPGFIRRELDKPASAPAQTAPAPATSQPAPPTETAEPAAPGDPLTHALHQLQAYPEWRAEAVAFFTEARAIECVVRFRGDAAKIEPQDEDWRELQKNAERLERFSALRNRLYKPRTLDAEVGEVQFCGILEYYFAEFQEVAQ